MSLVMDDVTTEMSDGEWEARCGLASLYHIAEHLGWTDLINTHFSARVPGEPDHFLINRFGESFEEVTASSLVKMDMEGNVVGRPGPFNKAGFTIHSGVYKARSDAMCIMHTHTPMGAGLSLIEKGLRPISQDALHVIDEVAYHPYGVPTSQEECEELGRSCQNGRNVVLYNHGLLVHMPTIHGTLYGLYRLERACELEVISRQMNVTPVAIDPYVIGKAAERMKKTRDSHQYGLAEYKALVRQIERKGADFRR